MIDAIDVQGFEENAELTECRNCPRASVFAPEDNPQKRAEAQEFISLANERDSLGFISLDQSQLYMTGKPVNGPMTTAGQIVGSTTYDQRDRNDGYNQHMNWNYI